MPVSDAFPLERELNYSRNGSTGKAQLSIGGIRQVDVRSWSCDYSFDLLDTPSRVVVGSDAIQALMLCIRHIRSLIEDANRNENTKIWWLDGNDNGGF